MDPLLHPGVVGKVSHCHWTQPGTGHSNAAPGWAPENTQLLLQCSPQQSPTSRNGPKMPFSEVLQCSAQHKDKNKSMWRVINEQSWLIVRLLTWSHIMLSPKLFLQKIITEGSICTGSSQMLTLLLLTVLLLLLMWKNRLTNSNVFCL